ncbi:MAG: hypothetical protein ACYDHG_02330 [Desulfomonilaceae bacterium]
MTYNRSTDDTRKITAEHGALESLLSKKSNKDIIIIFCRYPVPGKTKTRLIPALGPQGAADYHRLLSELIVSCARDFVKLHRRTAIEIYYT